MFVKVKIYLSSQQFNSVIMDDDNEMGAFYVQNNDKLYRVMYFLL